jgi:hypothetical protein
LHASSRYGINIGAPSAGRSRTEANALKKEGYILVRKNVKQKQAERHNQSLESTRNSAWQDLFKASFKAAMMEYFKALLQEYHNTNKKKPSARSICKDIGGRPGMVLVHERSV